MPSTRACESWTSENPLDHPSQDLRFLRLDFVAAAMAMLLLARAGTACAVNSRYPKLVMQTSARSQSYSPSRNTQMGQNQMISSHVIYQIRHRWRSLFSVHLVFPLSLRLIQAEDYAASKEGRAAMQWGQKTDPTGDMFGVHAKVFAYLWHQVR
jgi:hypothetical protein